MSEIKPVTDLERLNGHIRRLEEAIQANTAKRLRELQASTVNERKQDEIKPDHYWARRKLDEPGRPREWTVVLVEDTSAWSVWEIGSDVISDQGVWEFGPRLEPPEESVDKPRTGG